MEGGRGEAEEKMSSRVRKVLLGVNLVTLIVGSLGGPLTLRLYFYHGGSSAWLASWLQTAGWPVLLPPLLLSYALRRLKRRDAELFSTTARLLPAFLFLGLLNGVDNYLYAYGLKYLPVSTSSLVLSTQLGFTAIFAFLLVGHRFTPLTLNAVALFTAGAATLGLHSSMDRPKGVGKGQYITGLSLSLGAAALYGLLLPLIQLAYRKSGARISYTLLLESQLVVGFFATLFCTAGMAVHRDFHAIAVEAARYGVGEVKYYVVLASTGMMWQLFFMGTIGVTACGSSLLAGIVIAMSLPVVGLCGVFFYHEKFGVDKAMSLLFCLWGFASYFYGEYQQHREWKHTPPPPPPPPPPGGTMDASSNT